MAIDKHIIGFMLAILISGCNYQEMYARSEASPSAYDSVYPQIQAGSVTLKGEIRRLNEPWKGTAAIRVKVDGQWQPMVVLESNFFELSQLPQNTSFVLEVSSPENQFLPRAFYGHTLKASSGRHAVQELGFLNVSEGAQLSFSVLTASTLKPLKGLDIHYTASATLCCAANLAKSDEFIAHAQFDERSGQYTLQIPMGMDPELSLELDPDGDGLPNYRLIAPSLQSRKLTVGDLRQQPLLLLEPEVMAANR